MATETTTAHITLVFAGDDTDGIRDRLADLIHSACSDRLDLEIIVTSTNKTEQSEGWEHCRRG